MEGDKPKIKVGQLWRRRRDGKAFIPAGRTVDGLWIDRQGRRRSAADLYERLVQTSPDRVREMIHRFNDLGMRSLDPQWAGGRPRQITTTDRALIVKTATTRPRKLGRPFTHWSIRKLADYLACRRGRKVRVGRERLRQILHAEGITFQRTKTWKESPDPLKEHKLARIEWLLEHQRDRTFAFDEFGPLTIKPVPGTTWAARTRPLRLRANYRKPHGSRQLYACYSIGQDPLWGTIEPAKGSAPTLRAIQSIRAPLDDGEWIYVILDNLNHHLDHGVREWCEANRVELVFTPTYASWANPIEAHFGPLRQFVIANSDHADHPALARAIRAYLRWRNTHTPRPPTARRRTTPPSPHPQPATTPMGQPQTCRRIARERSWSQS